MNLKDAKVKIWRNGITKADIEGFQSSAGVKDGTIS